MLIRRGTASLLGMLLSSRTFRAVSAVLTVATTLSLTAANALAQPQPQPYSPPPQGGYPQQYPPPPQGGYPPPQGGYPQPYPPQQYPPPPQGGYPQQYPPQGGYPQQYPPQGGYPQQYPQQYPPQGGYPQQYPPPQYGPPPQGYPQQRPPAPEPAEAPEPEVPTHAPKFALYLGGRISYMGFGNAFYADVASGQSETTGRIVGNGPTFQLDLGVRLAKAWIPYGFVEHGLLSQGGYFKDTDAHASTTFVGGGLRHISGDPDSVSFMQDLSVGLRSVSVSRGDEKFTMSTFEWVRLGLGAEIRLHTRFTLSPLASISAGSMNDAHGKVTFNDGRQPQYSALNRETIDASRPYVALQIGLGFHFDLIGD